jgi:hypothetical protein
MVKIVSIPCGGVGVTPRSGGESREQPLLVRLGPHTGCDEIVTQPRDRLLRQPCLHVLPYFRREESFAHLRY